MSNQLQHLLQRWQPNKDKYQWVLATVVDTQGSSYRKAGAMLLINSMGQFDGLVSGGCLESDVMRQAQRVMESQQATVIRYDMASEDSSGWKLGLGCGGIVDVLLQPVTEANNYQALELLLDNILDRGKSYYTIDKAGERTNSSHYSFEQAQEFASQHIQSPISLSSEKTKQLAGDSLFIFRFDAAPKIAVFGGGLDAKPLVDIAKVMGWHVRVIDHRVGYARMSVFGNADVIYTKPFNELADAEFINDIDAAVIMGHNINFDAQSLALLQSTSAQYIGLLGPTHRKEKVIKATGFNALQRPISGPAGLNLGGELPESIALAILSEIHAYLSGSDARSLSNMLTVNNLKKGVA